MCYFVKGDGFVFVGFGVGDEVVDVVWGAIEGAAEFFHDRQADFIVFAAGDSVGEVVAYAMFGEEATFVFYVSRPEEGIYVVFEHGLGLMVDGLRKNGVTNETISRKI